MYKNDFILSIKKDDGEILRETNDYTVYLPFYSEYSIYLKNKNNRKAQVKIKIDGTDILGSSSLILNSQESLNLERFLSDNNLNSGKKFKFVSLNDDRVQDPTNSKNGLIEVSFKLEKEVFPVIKQTFDKYWQEKPYNKKRLTEPNNMNIYDDGHYTTYVSSFVPNMNTGISINSVNFVQTLGTTFFKDNQKGATIEGSESNQKFVYGHIGELEDKETTLTLQILAPKTDSFTIINYAIAKAYETVKNTKFKYCVNCNKKLRRSFNYCSKCGFKN